MVTCFRGFILETMEISWTGYYLSSFFHSTLYFMILFNVYFVYASDLVLLQISIVSQEPTLFNCSIAENISYGLKDNVKHEDIERVSVRHPYHF